MDIKLRAASNEDFAFARNVYFETMHFPISCAPGVQKTFERGIALLHSFAFETAEARFRQVAQDDPHCAMAHWGIAKTFSRWGTPDAKQLKHGWEEIKVATQNPPRPTHAHAPPQNPHLHSAPHAPLPDNNKGTMIRVELG